MKLTLIATLVSATALAQAASVNKCDKRYEVAAGDSCKSIASKLGFSESNFEKWNQELDSSFSCDDLKENDSICIKFPSSIEKRADKDQAQKDKTTDKDSAAKKSAKAKKARTTKKPTKAKKTKKQASKKSAAKNPEN